jgi:hypothetical protein
MHRGKASYLLQQNRRRDASRPTARLPANDERLAHASTEPIELRKDFSAPGAACVEIREGSTLVPPFRAIFAATRLEFALCRSAAGRGFNCNWLNQVNLAQLPDFVMG